MLFAYSNGASVNSSLLRLASSAHLLNPAPGHHQGMCRTNSAQMLIVSLYASYKIRKGLQKGNESTSQRPGCEAFVVISAISSARLMKWSSSQYD